MKAADFFLVAAFKSLLNISLIIHFMLEMLNIFLVIWEFVFKLYSILSDDFFRTMVFKSTLNRV